MPQITQIFVIIPACYNHFLLPTDASGGRLTRQPVVLIYASDNSLHSKVVHCLAAYLQAHCHCDVRFDQWSERKISEVSALDWILHQLKSVKNVVIVNSEAGFRLYKANMTEVAYEKILHETPLEDMFLPAMREIRSDYYLKPKSRKLFKVAFPYTDPEFFISDFHSGITYKLMSHIEDLFLHIHGLSKHCWNGKTTVVGVNHEDYTQSPEGLALEKAIREATEYFKQNPGWFSDYYQERPRMDQSNVCSSVDKNWMKEEYLAPHYFDSGLGTSLEKQNFLDNFYKNVPGDEQTETFKAPDPDDDISVSSENIELQIISLNIDYDRKLS